MSKDKVLMAVCNFFNPDNRVFRAANVVQENGFKVTLLAYHEKGLKEEENLGFGFKLRRLKHVNKLYLPKKINNILRYLNFKKKCKKIATILKPSIVHCHDYNTLFLGIYCKKKFGSKLIYDNHEYFQDLNYLHRFPLFVRKKIASFEKKCLKNQVDELIVVSPGIKELYAKIFKGNCTIIRNIPDTKFVEQKINLSPYLITFLEEQKKSSKKILLYLGTNAQKGRGFSFLQQLLPILNKEYSLLVCGAKSKEELDFLNHAFLQSKNNFFAQKSLNYSELVEISKFCFAGLSLIEPIYISYKHSLPNKLFEYISLNLPVIVSEIPDQRAFVEEYNVGISIPFELNIAKTKIEAMNKEDYSIQKAKQEVNWQREKQLYSSLYAKF